jgi:outer membrane assembly lipoprotein YfiO
MSQRTKITFLLIAALVIMGGDSISAADDADAMRLYQRGITLLAEGEPEEALERFNTIAKRHRGSTVCAQALWEIYRIQEHLGNDEGAFEALNRLTTEQPGHFEKAQETQLKLVRRLIGKHHEARPTLEEKKRPPTAAQPEILLAMLKAIIKSGPRSEAGIQAQFLCGLVHDRAGQKREAVATYEDFAEDFPQHELADDAAYQVADIPYRQWRLMRGDSPHQREAAAVGLAWFLARFPESDKAAQARACLAEVRAAERRELVALARFYDQKGKPKAAAVYYQQLGEKFPDEVAADEALAARVRAALSTQDSATEVGPNRPK